MRSILSGLLLLLALPAGAEIYKYLDANGNPVFSNQPPEGVAAEKVELPAPSIVTPPPPAPADAAKRKEQAAEAHYSRLELTGIPDGESLRANNGSFSVDVAIEPMLRPGHSLRLLLDGQPYGQPGRVTRLQLVNVDRGEHSLAVEVLAGDRALQQSAPLVFTVQRVHRRR
ncbi:DUF4124 domain-containing protein [Azotobacter salinestris]|uniref:DUF4124 domain-containing protein n=1 Tax=Azotobacter salinestris TaxID=69964 RepID=UPI0032DED8F2